MSTLDHQSLTCNEGWHGVVCQTCLRAETKGFGRNRLQRGCWQIRQVVCLAVTLDLVLQRQFEHICGLEYLGKSQIKSKEDKRKESIVILGETKIHDNIDFICQSLRVSFGAFLLAHTLTCIHCK